MKFVSFSMADEREVSDFTAMCFEGSFDEVRVNLKSINWAKEGVDPLHWTIKRQDKTALLILPELLRAGTPVDGFALYLSERFWPDIFFTVPAPSTFFPDSARSIDNALIDAARSKRATHIEKLADQIRKQCLNFFGYWSCYRLRLGDSFEFRYSNRSFGESATSIQNTPAKLSSPETGPRHQVCLSSNPQSLTRVFSGKYLCG